MKENFVAIIPARHGSTRLPGKVLLEIEDKPLIQHAYESACKSNAQRVLIATDSEEVRTIALGFNAECLLTSKEHASGTDRLAEVIDIIGLAHDTIVVNVQGDEIGLPPELIDQVAGLLANRPDAQMATLYEKIHEDSEINDPNVVKVVVNKNNEALYFSRSPIPWNKGDSQTEFRRHIGIYAYRAGFVAKYPDLPKCELEIQESLEQLRALYHGATIMVDEASARAGIGIDTPRDLERAREIYKNNLSV